MLPKPGSIVVIEATRPDGLPSLRRATLVAADSSRLGLHARPGLLADLQLQPGSLLRLHWGEPSDVHGTTTAMVASADAAVGPEGVSDGVVMAHLTRPDNDRRAHDRVRVPGRVTWAGGEGSLVDLGAGGLRIETTDKVVGQVSMVVHVGHRELSVEAHPIARADGEIRLVIQPGSERDLDDLVSSLVAALTLSPA